MKTEDSDIEPESLEPESHTEKTSATFPGFRSLKANFTTTPNQFFDRVIGHYKPCVERVVAILIRTTLGWEDPDTGERRLEAELALDDFVRPQLSRYSAREGLAGAIEAGFVVETLAATNRQPARYALRWEDAEAQSAAIARQRQSQGPLVRKGVPIQPPRWRRALDKETASTNSTVLPIRGAKIRRLKIRGKESRRLDSLPPNKKALEKKEGNKKEARIQTLNVEGGSQFVLGTGQNNPKASASRQAPWLDQQAQALADELQDHGSERRHRQLLGICEQQGLSDLPIQALRATQERLARANQRGAVEKPGAYYQRILIKLLADHQVFVPSAAERAEDHPEHVRALIQASLGFEAEKG